MKLDLLPEQLRAGKVLIDKGDFQEYSKVFLCAMLTFFGAFFAIKRIQQALKWKRYLRMSEQDKNYMTSGLSGIVHHVLNTSYVMYILINPQEACGPQARALEWFRSDLCFYSVDKRMVKAGLICSAYLFSDLVIQVCMVRGQELIHKQMLVHHVVGGLGILLTFFAGYGTPGICAAGILYEVSTPPLNIRAYYRKEEFDQAMPLFLQASFFILYTIFRILLSPLLLYFAYINIVQTW